MPRFPIPDLHTVHQIPPERVLSKVSWVTEGLRRSDHGPDANDGKRRKRVQRTIADYLVFYANAVRFLQDNGLTTHVILADGAVPTADTTVRAGDLTEEGLRFYYFGIRAWINRMEKARDKATIANDLRYPTRKLEKFRAVLAEEHGTR